MKLSSNHLASLGMLATLGLGTTALAVPVIPSSYSYIVPPQGGNPYPDSGNELTDGIYPTLSWGKREIRNLSQAAPYAGWQYVDPKIRFDFGRQVNIGSLILTADDGNGAAGVYFPKGVTIEMDGKTITRSIADPLNAGVQQEFISGLDLSGDSLTLSVDGGSRNWTMLGEIEFDTSNFVFNGYESGVQTTVEGYISSPLGTRLSQLTANRLNARQDVIDPQDGSSYTLNSSGQLRRSIDSKMLSEVSQSIADAYTTATVLAVHDFHDDGSIIDQISDAIGYNRASVASSNGLFGALQSQVHVTSGWWDYFMIDGHSGDGTLTLVFDVEGRVSGDDARIAFSLDAEDILGNLLADITPFYADQSTHGDRGFFTQRYSARIPFTYGELFKLSGLLDIFSSGNSQVDFIDTVKIQQIIVPDGATLNSSALEAGLVSADHYKVLSVSQASVSLPGMAALLLFGLGLLRRRC